MRQMREAFLGELQDLLAELDSALLALEADPDNHAPMHRLFRALHTIKGSGASAGFPRLVDFVHKLEDAFVPARAGRAPITEELIDRGLTACDTIRAIANSGADGGDAAAVEGEGAAGIGDALPGLPAVARPPASGEVEESGPGSGGPAAFHIVFKPFPDFFASGAQAATLFDDLCGLGQTHITAHVENVPPLPSLEPERCYLWWEIVLVTTAGRAAIEQVFVFVASRCELQIGSLEDRNSALASFASLPPGMMDAFALECEDELARMENYALALERDPASGSDLNDLFRSVHNVKGNAGLLLGYVDGKTMDGAHPLQLLIRAAHELESRLESFRGISAGPVTQSAIHYVLETRDTIRGLVVKVTDHNASGPIPSPLPQPGRTREGAPARLSHDDSGLDDDREEAFRNTTSQCMETIAHCRARLAQAEGDIGPVLATWQRCLKTVSAAAGYRKYFVLKDLIEQQLRILEAAVSKDAMPDEEERAALDAAFQATRSVLEGKPFPNRSASASSANPLYADKSNLSAERGGGEGANLETRPGQVAAESPRPTVRIDQSKIDRLVGVAGELLVVRGAFPVLAGKLSECREAEALVRELNEAAANVSRIADELQAGVMSMSMLPVGTVFSRFPRMVRDLARTLGKSVRLTLEGEDIELDRAILDQIGDPLVHLVRNAVDHGLEFPHERVEKGKSAEAHLTLRAVCEPGGVAIEVIDDGRGIDANALKQKAVEKELLSPESAAGMSDESGFQLIFLPGLSTAQSVTDLSGRGVGMDVVLSNVRRLDGRIEIRSKMDRGTTFFIRLPASLMVSAGILLEAGGEEFILPMEHIREIVKLPCNMVRNCGGIEFAHIRGRVLSLVRLAAIFGLEPEQTPVLSIAVTETDGASYGLVVGRFVDEVRVLVKPLTGGLDERSEFQGAAVMGDGRLVLVLNVLECLPSQYRQTALSMEPAQ
jgi:two-component system chemotaxis sensor kinase CheA